MFNDTSWRRRASALRGCYSTHTSIQFTPLRQSRGELACLFLIALFNDTSWRRRASALRGVLPCTHQSNSCLATILVGNWPACSSSLCSMTHHGGGGPPHYGGVNLRTHQPNSCLATILVGNWPACSSLCKSLSRRRQASALHRSHH